MTAKCAILRERPASGSGEPSPFFNREFDRVPCIGETIIIRENGHRVTDVLWYPREHLLDAQIIVEWS